MQAIQPPTLDGVWEGDIPYSVIFGLEFVGSFAAGMVRGKCADCGKATRFRGSFLGPAPHFYCLACSSFGYYDEDGILTRRGQEEFRENG